MLFLGKIIADQRDLALNEGKRVPGPLALFRLASSLRKGRIRGC
jgi:hypothetical protein